jgi:hypothetical protein
LRVWIYIHHQRTEWDAKEKEMVAYSLVELVGRASAANILGLTVRDLDKLVSMFEASERFSLAAAVAVEEIFVGAEIVRGPPSQQPALLMETTLPSRRLIRIATRARIVLCRQSRSPWLE